jgi:hypothetical protein
MSLTTASLLVEWDERTGALTRLDAVEASWPVVAREALGLSFALLVPAPGRGSRMVHGVAQAAPTVTQGPDRVVFAWASLVGDDGEPLDIAVTQSWQVDGAAIVVETSIDNRSAYTVENVFSPSIGGLRPKHRDDTLEAIRHDYGSGMRQPMWPTFDNSVGYWGADVPTQLAARWMPAYGSPAIPYTLIQGPDYGLSIGINAPTSELVAWVAQLIPGWLDSLESTVARDEQLAGVDVRIEFSAVHIPFIQPATSRTMPAIRIEGYSGDWHHGANLYRSWRSEHLTLAEPPAWAKEPFSWFQLQVNSTEDRQQVPFDQLVDYAREAAELGVAAIQLTGFNVGGQDRNTPHHDPDPRLGGFDVLKQAIADIQAMGVRVVLFCKFNWAEQSLPDYVENWRPLAIKDPYGDPYLHQGYRYDTITQLLDINTRRLVPMCFLDERYLDACVREFDTLLALGADGILYDECLHHMPTLLCFDESHGHRYGAPTYSNDLELIRRFRERLPADTDFLFAGEGVYDLEFQEYSLSYHRSEERNHLPLHRYTAPHQQMSTAATGFDDRNMVNQSLLYRYIVSYEPKNFHGFLHDFPFTVAYGEAMGALRRELRRWLWEGTFHDTVGATVLTSAGETHHPYTVFTDDEGVPAIVVANYDNEPVELSVDVSGPHRWRTIDDPQWHELEGGRLFLAGRSAAVIVPMRSASDR